MTQLDDASELQAQRLSRDPRRSWGKPLIRHRTAAMSLMISMCWFAVAVADAPVSPPPRATPFRALSTDSEDSAIELRLSDTTADETKLREPHEPQPMPPKRAKGPLRRAIARSLERLPTTIGAPPPIALADAEFSVNDWPAQSMPQWTSGDRYDSEARVANYIGSLNGEPVKATPASHQPPILVDPNERERANEYPFPFNGGGDEFVELTDEIFIREPADDEPLGVVGRQIVPPATVDGQTPRPGQPLGGDFFPVEDRWRIGFPEWDRWARSSLANPYRASVLKGDFPIFGKDQIFNQITVVSDSVLASKDTAVAGGKVNDRAFVQTFLITYDLFKEDNTFIPSPWFLSVTPVLQIADGGADQSALQVAFADVQLAITSDYYDEVRLRVGRQAFNSDFLGFVFVDANDAARLFWTKDAKQTFGDIVFFNQVQKEGGFNSFTSREQQIAIARLQRQDFIFPGFNTLISFLYNNDDGGQNNSLDGYWLELAWAGRLGRFETTGAFVQAWGHDSMNPIAKRPINANAQMVAAEVKYPMDWIKPKLSALFATGDGDPNDGKGTGFDGVFDNPQFAGNGFSYFSREAIVIGGTRLTNGFSPLPNMRAKAAQSSNFVNPGILILNAGFETVLSARAVAFADANYFRFARTQSIQQAFNLANKPPKTVGMEIGGGVVYKPFIVDNIQIVVGASVFNPGSGISVLTGDTRYLYTAFSAFTAIY